MTTEPNNQPFPSPPPPKGLRGRAKTPVRPGRCIREALLGMLPLEDGRLVTEASITDLHGAYKMKLKEYNAILPKEKKLRGMSIYSFTTIFKFARLLKLVEHVRDEPRISQYGGNLYRVEDTTGLHIVPGTRKIYKLSEKGKADTISWDNLQKSWYAQRNGSKPNGGKPKVA